VAGVQQLELTAYTRIPLEESQLEVSSTNHPAQGKDNLVKQGMAGYWHVKIPKEETRPWILVDMKTKQSVAALGIIGRKGTNQMWRGYRAVLEASDDKQNWKVLARLGLSDDASRDEWTYFQFPESRPYRYYRFSTYDWSFMSLARLTMYVPAGALAPLPASSPKPPQIRGTPYFDLSPYDKIPLESSQLEVSSFNGPWDETNLVKAGTTGFWHVQHPRQEERAWVLVDLGTKQAVPLLRVRPRADFRNQMWYGYTADLEISNDKQNWTTLATLGLLEPELTGDWVYFLVGNLQPYRYYRLSIWDRYFYSMARLELYRLSRETAN